MPIAIKIDVGIELKVCCFVCIRVLNFPEAPRKRSLSIKSVASCPVLNKSKPRDRLAINFTDIRVCLQEFVVKTEK